jgi:hypothetical protein
MNRNLGFLGWVNLFLLAALVYLLADGMPSLLEWRRKRDQPPPPRPAFFDWLDPAKGMQLIMFYASPGVIERGDSASLCYGVAQAASVRIEPPVANVWPSLNRCFTVAPSADTTYRIILADAKGKEISESLTLRVVKPGTIHPVEYVPAPVAVKYFRVKEKFLDGGATCYALEFATESAEVVTIDPPVFPSGRVIMGSFYVKPGKTTTYRITAEGRGRKAFRELTVEVP